MDKLRKVLIADDDKFIRDSLKDFLSEHFEVKVIGDGFNAVRELINQSFDILLLDLNLPHLCGENIFRILRTMNMQTLVYVITGDADLETEKRARSMGVDGFFLKPVERQLLLEEMKAGLKHADSLNEKTRTGNRK